LRELTGSQSAVLLQAYCYGRPVIASDVGGLGEIVREDTVGLVVPPGSQEHLSEAVIKMLASQSLFSQYERNMSRAIKEKYSWNIVADTTLRVYYTLLGK